MFFRSSFVFTAIFLLLCAPALFAGENEIIFNQVRLNAQAEREVENDQLLVSVAVEAQGTEPDKLASRVNETMQWALDMAKKQPGVQVSTKSYQTFPVYKDRIVVAWRASQMLELKSVEISKLTELTGKLQERLQVKEMVFIPTTEARIEVENALIEEAMGAFKRRVEIVGKHMKEKNYRIIEMNINTGGYQPPVMFAERASMKTMAMDAAPPAVEAGTSKITVTISGSVQFF